MEDTRRFFVVKRPTSTRKRSESDGFPIGGEKSALYNPGDHNYYDIVVD